MNDRIYDFAVIGAGPAGCFAALELLKRGKTVLVFEKEAEGHRKVCGDGISKECVALLEKTGFPKEEFERCGAAIIKDRIVIDENNIKHTVKYAENDHPYGLSRGFTDKIFQDYLKKCGVEIIYNRRVQRIEKTGSGYMAEGFYFRDYIIAGGVLARQPESNLYIHTPKDNPIGISMIIRAKTNHTPFFLFDYNPEYRGTYGWIFKIEGELWNVGLWLREDHEKLKYLFSDFVKNRVGEYFPQGYEIVTSPKSAFLAAHGDRAEKCIGDAAGSCSYENGEGIRQAILSAVEYVSAIK